MKSKLKGLLFLFMLTASNISYAGFAGGPYLLWINLSENKSIDEIISKNLGAGEDCGEPDIHVVPAPEWISRDLVNKALTQNDKNSISSLDKLIRKTYPGFASQGLDGIIVYNESPKPHFSNFVRGRRAILKEHLKKLMDEQATWRAFCLLVPPITRPI